MSDPTGTIRQKPGNPYVPEYAVRGWDETGTPVWVYVCASTQVTRPPDDADRSTWPIVYKPDKD